MLNQYFMVIDQYSLTPLISPTSLNRMMWGFIVE